MRFFTSDTHFGCDEILKRENRPFKNVEEFENFIFNIWNLQAKETDIIYHLGDFVNYNKDNNTGWQKSFENVKRVNAKIILIIGNNEQRIINEHFDKNFEAFRSYCKNIGFFDVKKDDSLQIENLSIYLNHFPKNHKENYLNLFGHTHRTTGLWKPYGLNVGCDLNHFYLFSEEEIKRLNVLKLKYWDSDEDNLCFNENTVLLNNLERYRDYFLAKNILEHDFIGFYPREFFCFDNFSSFAILYKGVKYPTVEHAYQAMKFIESAPEVAKEIVESYSADEAKRIATRNKAKQDEDWDNKKISVMEDLLRTKLNQNPYVKKKLLQTKDYIICEDSPMDDFWGIGENRDGQNQLGKLWMKLREELMKN